MMKIKVVIDMNIYSYQKAILIILALLFTITSTVQSQNRDNLPPEYREYTNPEEVVSFDRTTPFSRALDVINEYAQKFRGKVVLNKTETSGEIGISVPAMHWMDALKLILRVKELVLVEKQEFFQIVTKESLQPEVQQTQATGGGGSGEGEGPVATTQTHEVRINAIFFEGNKRALQEIGVDWSTISENVPDQVIGGGQGGGQGGGGQGGQGGGQIPNSSFDGPFVQVNSRGAQSVSQNVFDALVNVGEIGNSGIRVQALFSAFEADNLGEIIASPNIKVMEGQQGRIQVGQDFSIKQRDIAGNVIEKFVSVGTILEVTPQVIEQEDTTFIHLDINAQRSSAQPDPVSTIINKTQAQTQALLLDDEATVVAGLYNTEEAEVRRGVPILKDLPPWFFGLRYLFGYNSKDYSSRELVIILEASLEPTIPQRVGKENFRDNYEVLRDERSRMQQEIQEGDEIMEGERLRDKDTDPQEQDTTSTDEQMSEQDEQQQNESAEEDTADAQTEESRQEEDKPEESVITDPEVQTQTVQLDLGGNSDTTAMEDENQQATQADTTTAEAEEPAAPQTRDEMDQQQNNSLTYYLIGGSFKVEQNALDFRKELRGQGYDPVIINMDGSDIMLVAYMGYDDLDSAKSGLSDIQQNQNSGAWLYKAN